MAVPSSPNVTQEPSEDHQPLQRSLLKGRQTKGTQTKALSALAPSAATPESVFAAEAAVTCNQRQSAEEEAEERAARLLRVNYTTQVRKMDTRNPVRGRAISKGRFRGSCLSLKHTFRLENLNK